MKRFECPNCGDELHFRNTKCLSCDTPVAINTKSMAFAALPEAGTPCANRDLGACNWLVAEPGNVFCPACTHNRTIPDLSQPGNLANWQELELSKRYLFYSLLRWNMPHPTRDDREDGLAFDFLADTVSPEGEIVRAMTGHGGGLITLAIAEADDAERVARRESMGEPYRTLIGHMRHEVGHFYWDLLVRDSARLTAFRTLFGDEREDYGEAIERHYANGAPEDWPESYISSYATAHPWEDFAETFAHYVHIVDACETAHAWGMTLHPVKGTDHELDIEADPYVAVSLDALLDDWVPLTVGMNALNRSMGQADFYPFVLSDPVKAKLGFMHDLIRDASGPSLVVPQAQNDAETDSCPEGHQDDLEDQDTPPSASLAMAFETPPCEPGPGWPRAWRADGRLAALFQPTW